MAQDNIDRSINAQGNTGTQSWFSLSVSKDAKEMIISILLAVTLVALIYCIWIIDQYKSEIRLAEYDLSAFKSGEYAQLKAHVEANDMLMQSALNCKK